MTTRTLRLRWTRQAALLWLLVSAVLGLVTLAFLRIGALGTQDFRAFYAAGQMLRHARGELYDLAAQLQWQRAAGGGDTLLPFYHLAYETLFYLPLTAFSFKAAYMLYACWNMMLLWLCYLASPAGCSIFAGTKRPSLYFLSFPLLLCCFVGQNALLVLLVITLAYHAMLKEQDARAGLLLGLIVSKLAVVCPLVFLLAIRRGARFAAGFIASSVTLIALSVWMAGTAGAREFLRLLGSATLASDNTAETQRHIGVWLHAMPNLTGLLYLLGSGHLPAHAAFALNMAANLAVVGLGVYILRRSRSEGLAFSAAIVCTVLISPHLHIYDFSSLTVPMLLLSHRWLKYVAVLWFAVPPLLYAYGFLTWLAPAVVIPLGLLVVCVAEFRAQTHGCIAPEATALDHAAVQSGA